MAFRPAGFGGEVFSDPFGTGGPIQVVRALAVAGQVVRLALTEPPLMDSPGGAWDGRNPANYVLAVPGGQATVPVPVGVTSLLIPGPARGVEADQVGVDVHVDRQLMAGVAYQITARNLRTPGGLLVQGAPYSAIFQGVTQVRVITRASRDLDLIDFANPQAVGHWIVDDSSDLAVEAADVGCQKRIERRVFTPRDSFSFLKGYGGPLRIKSLASPSAMEAYRNDLLAQVQEEPDVVSAQVSIMVDARNLIFVSIRAKTRRGTFVNVDRKFDPGGARV